ncbi:rab-GTPase-TBC domain-containing protein [Hypoxylon rubiginosum]|uniref:Rab-GTPase-TBC domain-containing protein n=1 Tax=Hypoxylon rubiginosum TaxID=110542 RepID=A0ACC0CZU9_9PEZI|nr:rab-GTPase-TBC domain-containing protein [Hypoxylon rubiginosum]
MKFREFGLHASRTQDSKHTPVRSILPNANTNTNTNANPNTYNYNYHDQDNYGYEADEDDDFENTSSNPVWSPSVAYSTPQTSIASYPHSVEDPSSPCVPISPRWDSLGYDRAVALSPTSPTFSNHHSRSSNTTDELYLGANSLAFGARDEFPLLSTKKLNTTEPVRVDNFSRKRKPSIKQPYNDPNQFRPTNQATGEPAHLDNSSHPLSWPRERGPSVSSDMSAATFASAPIRGPDMHNRDNVRSRGRQQNYPVYRPPVSYRAESSGPTYARDPLPRMASVPNDELRSSYRSQLSASTGQGTAATERSSVVTKSSSITSVYGAVDDSFSIDDVMGMYEKGFYDDSAAEENDSRPPTAISEERRRRATVLDAMNDLMSKPGQPITIPGAGPIVRDSASIFRDPNMRDSIPQEIPEESPEEAPRGNNESANADINNDHNNIEADEESDEEDNKFPSPSRQPTNLTAAEDVSDRDRYGFRKSNQYVSQEQYDGWNQGYTEYLARRRRKWMAYLREHGLMTDNPNRFPPRSNKTKRFVRKGIPPDWRGAAWFYYAGGPAVLAKHPGMYDTLLKQNAKEVDVEAIERDLHRTFPDNVRFRSSDSPTASNQGNQQGEDTENAPEKRMISSLRRVLHAFSIYNPRIGYCQSLNFLAGLLLLFVETEEHAFWLLNIITRVYLPGTHEMSLEGANVDLGVLMSSLREAMPNVWLKIGGELDGTEADAAWPLRWKHRHAPEPTQLPPITLCMTAWFMSCFIGTLPIETTLRVWDVFFYEGSKTLFRIALAIFKIGESEIRAVTDPMEIFQVVQTIPRRLVDANGLMEACFKRRNGFGHLSQETVEQKRQERRNLVKAERENLARKTEPVGPNMDTKKKGALFSRHKEKV